MLLIGDYFRITWVTFLKEKSEAFDKFKALKALVENEIGLKIKCLRADRGSSKIPSKFVQRNHPKNLIIGDKDGEIKPR